MTRKPEDVTEQSLNVRSILFYSALPFSPSIRSTNLPRDCLPGYLRWVVAQVVSDIFKPGVPK